MNILCTVCARGGSKGIKDKNLKKLNGEPLILHTLKKALKSKIFDKIVLSSDSKKIINVSKKYVDHVIKRPKVFASDKASKLLSIKHALIVSEKYFEKSFDIIFDLDVTSPLREIKDIINAKKKFINSKYNNLVSVCESRKNPYFNMVEKKKNGIKIVKNKIDFIRRQDAPKIYDLNASIYIWNRRALINNSKIVNNKTGFFVMPKSRSIDIDDEFDFQLIKKLIKKKGSNNE
jgi:CMP-N,N'-diacetyllegionaminic acid synthase